MDIACFKKLLLGHDNKSKNLSELSQLTGIPKNAMAFYLEEEKFPLGEDLKKILAFLNLPENIFRLKVGSISYNVLDSFLEIPIKTCIEPCKTNNLKPEFQTQRGKLYKVDCIELLESISDNSVDMIFADPPFNLSKIYPSNINDSLSSQMYLRWSERWIIECCRVLKFGGALFIWNLPKWNYIYASILNEYLLFRHWIAVDIKHSLPIPKKLYPSHYSLLYFIKGESPITFTPDRLEMEVCKKCFHEIKDYGGYKSKMNPSGINLTDVWHDIFPVRHNLHKKRKEANELSIKLLDRIIEMSTKEGDLIFDPFGGSGTTYIVSEIKNRKWIGCEIGPIDIIKDRFTNIAEENIYLNNIRSKYNHLFTHNVAEKRKELGIWLPENLNSDKITYRQTLLELNQTCMKKR